MATTSLVGIYAGDVIESAGVTITGIKIDKTKNRDTWRYQCLYDCCGYVMWMGGHSLRSRMQREAFMCPLCQKKMMRGRVEPDRGDYGFIVPPWKPASWLQPGKNYVWGDRMGLQK